MVRNYMQLVQKVRLGIYIAGITAVAILGICKIVHADEPIVESPQTFWPPDMIPHPHPPQPEPKDDNLA